MAPKRPREESSDEEEEQEDGGWHAVIEDGESWQQVASGPINLAEETQKQEENHEAQHEEDESEWAWGEQKWITSTTIPASRTQSIPDGPIQVDPDIVVDLDDDNDSIADTESLWGSTASISSSILEYREIHGRRYQSSDTTEYWAPNDEKHTESNDIAHQFTLMLMNDQLHLAPIGRNPQNILDVGTGTGIWARDAADEYPSALVIGTDISMVQPGWTLPNCSFQIDDAQLPWTFQGNHFDFIHLRYLYGGIDDWGKLYRQAFTHVRPDGWVESTEIDLTTRSENPKVESDPNHLFKKWCRLFFEAGDKIGRTFKIARDGDMEKLMREAGFVDLVHRQWKVPMGGWAKDPKLKQIGLYNGSFIEKSLDGFAVFPVGQVLGRTFEEVDTLVSQMREALQDPRSLPYYNIHTVYGRKPKQISTSDDESLL